MKAVFYPYNRHTSLPSVLCNFMTRRRPVLTSIQSPPTPQRHESYTSSRKNGVHSFVVLCPPLAARPMNLLPKEFPVRQLPPVQMYDVRRQQHSVMIWSHFILETTVTSGEVPYAATFDNQQFFYDHRARSSV